MAYDISVLEFIGVPITSVWYLDQCIALHCARAPSLFVAVSARGQDVTSNDTFPFWLKHFAQKPILFQLCQGQLSVIT